MKNRTPEESRNRINRLSAALFGTSDEIGAEEAQKLLNEAGLDSELVNEAIYRQLYAEAQKFWIAQNELPPLLKKALEALRPLSAPARNESELAHQARVSVERVVNKAKLLASTLLPEIPIEFAESYRNKKDLTAGDRKSLDAVQEQLRKKIDGLKRQDD